MKTTIDPKQLVSDLNLHGGRLHFTASLLNDAIVLDNLHWKKEPDKKVTLSIKEAEAVLKFLNFSSPSTAKKTTIMLEQAKVERAERRIMAALKLLPEGYRVAVDANGWRLVRSRK